MNGQDLLRSMNHVEEAFLAEAMEAVPAKNRRWKAFAGLAACFLLLAGAALWWSQQPYVIRLDQVTVHPVSAVHRAEPVYDPATVQTVSWDSAQVAEYYGKDLTPAYIPEALEPINGKSTAEVLVKEDGTVVRDAVELDFYTGYSPDGTLETQNVQGFSMTVSTEETLIYEYVDSESGRQMLSINGVDVTLGEITLNDHRGEYAAFGAYTAEFAVGDLCYSLRFHQMEMEEVVKVVASIIQEDSNIVVE